MSADNGIYILKTLAPGVVGEIDRYEYRVTEAGGIDNIYYDVASGEHQKNFIPQEAFRYFGGCQVFKSEGEALDFAGLLARDTSPLEYGICTLDHPGLPFQTFSAEQMEFFEADQDAIMAYHQEKRRVESTAKLEAATVQVSEGMTFEPGNVYGYLVQEDGTKVHGTLKGLQRLTVLREIFDGENGFGADLNGDGLNLSFLPSNWNK